MDVASDICTYIDVEIMMFAYICLCACVFPKSVYRKLEEGLEYFTYEHTAQVLVANVLLH